MLSLLTLWKLVYGFLSIANSSYFYIEDYSNSVDSFEITEEYTLDTLPLWKKFHFLKKERERIVER